MENKLLKLLEVEAEKLAIGYREASIEGQGTPQEVADRREGVFKAFLGKYFPFPNKIVKGNIIDFYGNNSASIDCIVLSPSHPYTVDPQNEKASVIFADGVDYAIEIKPNLALESEIHRGLKQIQSVKKLRRVRDSLLFKSKYTTEQITLAKTIPCCIVVDETFADIKKLINKIVDYYVNNKVPYIEQFDIMLINNRAVLINYRPNCYKDIQNKASENDKKRAIAFWEGGSKSLAWFLLEMNTMPRSEPLISENIMEIYLNNVRPTILNTFEDINLKLITAGV